MHDDSGVKGLLKIPSLYSLLQKALGGEAARAWFLREFGRIQPGYKVIDIGCGPGDILELLPDIEYVGIDISEAYIRRARQRFASRGLFLAGTVDDYRGDERLRNADVVLCFAVLHHLEDDETSRLLSFARENLKPGGRFVGFEPVILAHHQALSRWVMSRDRGRNVRREDAWKTLLSSEFPDFSTHVLTGLIRIPYTHIVLEGKKPGI